MKSLNVDEKCVSECEGFSHRIEQKDKIGVGQGKQEGMRVSGCRE